MLQVIDIHTNYGESQVLRGVSIDVRKGTCVSVLGRNGVGKTTTLRSILGLTPPRQGKIILGGKEIQTQKTFRTVQEGAAYVPEDRGVYSTLSVDEHLRMAHSLGIQFAKKRSQVESGAGANHLDQVPGEGALLPEGIEDALEHMFELFPNLANRLGNFGNELSGGEQQMLAMARALLLRPRLLILDEPSEGLAPILIDGLEKAIRSILASGATLLLVEQNYQLATSLADWTYVLSQGEIVFSGDVDSLDADEETKERYIGV